MFDRCRIPEDQCGDPLVACLNACPPGPGGYQEDQCVQGCHDTCTTCWNYGIPRYCQCVAPYSRDIKDGFYIPPRNPANSADSSDGSLDPARAGCHIYDAVQLFCRGVQDVNSVINFKISGGPGSGMSLALGEAQTLAAIEFYGLSAGVAAGGTLLPAAAAAIELIAAICATKGSMAGASFACGVARKSVQYVYPECVAGGIAGERRRRQVSLTPAPLGTGESSTIAQAPYTNTALGALSTSTGQESSPSTMLPRERASFSATTSRGSRPGTSSSLLQQSSVPNNGDTPLITTASATSIVSTGLSSASPTLIPQTMPPISNPFGSTDNQIFPAILPTLPTGTAELASLSILNSSAVLPTGLSSTTI